MIKVALFDFCETLANFQTADAFVQYVCKFSTSKSIERKRAIHSWLYRHKIIRIVNKFFPKLYLNKRLFLWRLKGLNESVLDDYAKQYYFNVVKPNLIPEVVEEMRVKQNDNWQIVIVSAGYDIYLKYFADDYGVPRENIMADQLAFKKNICLGKLLDGEIMFKKTELLDKRFNKNEILSVAYSDSMTDLPLLQWANQGIVIRRIDKSWAQDYGFGEILWKKESDTPINLKNEVDKNF